MPPSEFRCATYSSGQGAHKLRIVILLPAPVTDLTETRPLLFVHGGPGYPLGLDSAGARYWRNWVMQRGVNRPVVLFDQRGVGGSEPVFSCREYDGAARRVLTKALPVEREFAIWSEATARCRQRINGKGYRPDEYSSAANAADAAGIMQALGVRHWDAYGVSYGSRVLLEMLEVPPAGLQSVVLDSVVPLNRNPLDELPFLLGGGLARLFDACADQPSCDAMLPTASRQLLGLLAELQREPQSVTVRDPEGEKMIVILHDRRLLEVLFHGIYAQGRIERLPAMLAAAGEGDWQAMQPLVQHLVNWLFDPLLAEPVYYQTICKERHAETGRQRFSEGMHRYPELAPYMSMAAVYDLCKAWGVAPANETDAPAPSWQGPVLLLAGHFDPVTPADWASEVAAALPASTLYISPHSAHAVLDNDDCAANWVSAFLEGSLAPSLADSGSFAAPDCADESRRLRFAVSDQKASD